MKPRSLWPLYSVSELDDLPEPVWLVKGHITDGLTVVYGPPGKGKTFLALSWALSIATGRRWYTNDVVAGPVLYVSGEGGGGLSRRIRAWRLDATAGVPNLYVILGTVQLHNHQHLEALRDDIHSTNAKLVVVDTLARSMSGADENSAQDMGLVINGLDFIRRETGCASLIVHHSGVEKTRPRGSTALFGAADTLIRVDGDDVIEVSCEKQKEARRFRRLNFQLRELGGSCVLAQSASLVTAGFTPGDFV